MGLLRTWRCHCREKTILRIALAATAEELSHRKEHHEATRIEFARAKRASQRRNDRMREMDTELRQKDAAVRQQRAQVADLQQRVHSLATPAGSPCAKLAWHSEGEARVFGEWLTLATGCGEMQPYTCNQCRPHVLTGQPVWHSTHADEVRRGLANATHTKVGNRLPPDVLRSLRERFAAESDAWVQDQR